MKRFLLFLLLLTGFSCLAQEEILFYVHYQPNKVYRCNTIQDSETVTEFFGPKSLLKRLNKEGTENPRKKSAKSRFRNTNTTGEVKKDSTFPIEIKFTGGTNSPIAERTRIFGKVSRNQILLDSMYSMDYSPSMKNQVLKSARNLISQVVWDKKRMRVGDSLTIVTPLDFPIGEFKFNCRTETTYVLREINGNTAKLDVRLEYRLDMGGDKHFSGTGKGSGYLVYDIANFYYTEYNLKSELGMHVQTDDMDFSVSTTQDMRQTVEIPSP